MPYVLGHVPKVILCLSHYSHTLRSTFFASDFSHFVYVSHFIFPPLSFNTCISFSFDQPIGLYLFSSHILLSNANLTLTPFRIIFLHLPKTLQQPSFEMTIINRIFISKIFVVCGHRGFTVFHICPHIFHIMGNLISYFQSLPKSLGTTNQITNYF